MCRTLLFGAGLLLLLVSGCLASRPNIILIVADDMGWNDLSHHGGEIPTPNIDALGHSGIFLDRHYCQPTCTPSRAALLTSKYPSRMGFQGTPLSCGQPLGLPLDETLLPEYFKELGYRTHLVGKWHLGFHKTEYLPTRRGFDTHFGFWGGYIGHYDGVHFNNRTKLVGLDIHRGVERAWKEAYGKHITTLLTEEAVDVIRRHDDRDSFLMLLAHAAPHTGNIGLELMAPEPGLGSKGDHIKDPKRRVYADMVKALDDSVGKVVATLKEEGLLENTIIAFFSDNGAPTTDPLWGYANHGSNWPLRGEKCSAHEGGVRTGGVLWTPHQKRRGIHYDNVFHVTDWLPTLYSAAGGDSRRLSGLDGVDHWLSLLTNPSPPPRMMLLADMDDSGAEALIFRHWKIIRDYEPEHEKAFSDGFYGEPGRGLLEYSEREVRSSPAGIALSTVNDSTPVDWSGGLVIECNNTRDVYAVPCHEKHCLFDLRTDPCEHHDVARDYPQLMHHLLEVLAQYRREMTPKPVVPIDPASDPSQHDNYWSPWLDAKNRSSFVHDNVQFLLRTFVYSSTVILVWVNYT